MEHMRKNWQSYKATVINPAAGEVQIRETKMAFYAGAMVVATILETVAALPEDAAVETLESLKQEIMDHFQKETTTVVKLPVNLN